MTRHVLERTKIGGGSNNLLFTSYPLVELLILIKIALNKFNFLVKICLENFLRDRS